MHTIFVSLFPFGLLFCLFITNDITFALPKPGIDDIHGFQRKTNIGKDQLNINHSTSSRRNIMKSVFIIAGSTFILITIGGITSIIAHYVKKK